MDRQQGPDGPGLPCRYSFAEEARISLRSFSRILETVLAGLGFSPPSQAGIASPAGAHAPDACQYRLGSKARSAPGKVKPFLREPPEQQDPYSMLPGSIIVFPVFGLCGSDHLRRPVSFRKWKNALMPRCSHFLPARVHQHPLLLDSCLEILYDETGIYN